MPNLELTLSIVATTLSVVSFGGAAWRLWQDRARLLFYVTPITFTNVPHFGEMKMVQIMICNIGYRPIILTRFAAIGDKSFYQMGIDDEPSAAIGLQDQKFPVLLEPGKTLKIHPIGIEALRRNLAPPESPQHFHDPFRYFLVTDSSGRIHPMPIDEVAWNLRITDKLQRRRGWGALKVKLTSGLFLREARKRMLDNHL